MTEGMVARAGTIVIERRSRFYFRLVKTESTSIVITRLKKVDAVGSHPIDQPVLLRKSSGPASCQYIFERFGFADPDKRISDYRLNQL